MNLVERDLVFQRILAAWPRPPMPDPTQSVWIEHLSNLDYGTCLVIVDNMIKDRPRRPALSDFIQAYKARRPSSERGHRPPACGMCVNGWVEIECQRPDCGIPNHVQVTRCPNGCMPMTSEEREAHSEFERRKWDDDRRQRVKTGGGTAPIDFTDTHPHDPDEPF